MARGKVDIKGTISDAIYIATNLITCDRACVKTCDSPHLAYSSVEKTAMRGLEPRPPLSHHFRMTLCICFKTILCAKPFI